MDLFLRKDKGATIGVAFYADQIRTANRSGSRGVSVPCNGPDDWPQACERLLAQLPDKAQLHLLLPHGQLHHVSIDRPQGDDQALSDALFWQVKDSLPLSPQDIQLDYHDPPVQPMGSNRVNVICTSRRRLSDLVRVLSKGKRRIGSIGCEELAIGRLLPPAERPQVLLVRTPDTDVLLAVYSQGQLLFSRWLQGFGEPLPQHEPLLGKVAERLSLDIQRSLDYVESQLRQPPCQQIWVTMGQDDQALCERIGAHFSAPVAPFSPGPGELAHWMAQAAAGEAS